MNKTLNFARRNFMELLRDPVLYVFCLGFPLVMLVLFHVIGRYTGGHTPMFALKSLLPGILMFSSTFVMLAMSLLVSKDRQTFFVKRLYSSPMRAHDFVLGYAIVGIAVGLAQAIICMLAGLVLALIGKTEFLPFGKAVLLVLSQMPMILTNVFFGILFGTLLNDKSSPGVSSVFISLSGVLGGCWMPLEAMGGFAEFCRCLPFFPSVCLGRIVTEAQSALGTIYTFDRTAALGFVPIAIFLTLAVGLAFLVFARKMKES